MNMQVKDILRIIDRLGAWCLLCIATGTGRNDYSATLHATKHTEIIKDVEPESDI